MTIEEIAETIIRMTGSTSQIVYRPLPVDDPKVRQPDITRARTLLGWEPKVALEEGLTSTIDYFRQKLGRLAARRGYGRVGRHAAARRRPRDSCEPRAM